MFPFAALGLDNQTAIVEDVNSASVTDGATSSDMQAPNPNSSNPSNSDVSDSNTDNSDNDNPANGNQNESGLGSNGSNGSNPDRPEQGSSQGDSSTNPDSTYADDGDPAYSSNNQNKPSNPNNPEITTTDTNPDTSETTPDDTSESSIKPLEITRDVSTLAELNQAIADVPETGSTGGISVITLTANIAVSPGTLTIPAYKYITLQGDAPGRVLSGANGYATVTVAVNGNFRLGDNLTITHPAGATGDSRGVYINGNGIFYMDGGTISSNTANTQGGGVYTAGGGQFYLNGGTIASNHLSGSVTYGGGVYTATSARFFMYGGTISSNSATRGGALFVGRNIYSHMSGGQMVGNSADWGGAICLDAANNAGFQIHGGTLADNTASTNGGAVWVTNSPTNLNCLVVDAGVVFSSNKAGTAYARHIDHDGLYTAMIQTTDFTYPFTQGYNNYDIGYIWGEVVDIYTVTFIGNNGAPASQRRSIVSGTSFGAAHMPTVSRSGYLLVGWFDSSASTGGTELNATSIINSDMTVYARWGMPYTVTVNGNGSTGSTGAGVYAEGITVRIFAGFYSGRRFAGWTVDFGGAVLADVNSESTSFVLPGNNVTVTANWAIQYTVTFNGNGGGTPSPPTISVDSGTATSALPSVSRSGYVFMNWWDTPDSIGGTQFFASTIVTGNRTVYARWGHAVTVISDGAINSSGSGNYIEGALVSIFAGTNSGYHFTGWTVTSGSVTLADATNTTTSFTMPTTDVTVTANWSIQVTVIFNGNGNGAPDQSRTVDFNTSLGTAMPANPSRTGFEFMGWFTVAANTGGTAFDSSTRITSNYTVYARWGHRVSITANGGIGSTGEGIYTEGETVTIFSGTRTGHRFDYWAIAAGSPVLANTNSATTTFTMPTTNVTVRPEWKVQVTVTFNSNGGNTPNPASVTIDSGTSVVTLPSVNHAGYVFMGWFTVQTNTGGTQFLATTIVTSTITVYARWGHSLTVNGNGSTGSTGGGDYAEGTTALINAGTRVGYRFVQWTFELGTASLGSATSASTTLTMPSTDVIVRANWIEQFTITFDGNGGTNPSPSFIEVDTGQTVISLPNSIRSGYVLKGWFTVSANTGGFEFNTSTTVHSSYTVYARWARTLSIQGSYGSPTGAGDYLPGTTVNIDAGTRAVYRFKGWVVTSGSLILANPSDAQNSFTMPDENLTLTATWQETHIVTFNSQAGTPASFTRTVDNSDSLGTNMPPDPTRSSYVFMGWWDTTNSGGGNQFTATTTVTLDRTVYARWGHNVVVDGNGSQNSSGSGTYAEGNTVSINAGTRPGYRFDGWQVVSGNLTLTGAASASLNFTMPNTNVELRANWQEEATVTFSGNGGIPLSQSRTVQKNLNVDPLPQVSNAGFVFLGWYTVSATTGGSEFTNATPVSSDITVYARWGRTVTVLSSYATTTGAGDYVVGATVTINAGTRSGYTFNSWVMQPTVSFISGNANFANPSFTMPNANVIATAFWNPVVTVTGSYAPAGTNGAGSYAAGATVTINAGTRAGYIFTGWTTNPQLSFTLGNADTPTASFTMPSVPVNATASWDNLYEVTVVESFATTTGAGQYTSGSTVHLDAGTRAGYTFKSWTITPAVTLISGTQGSTTLSFTMPSSDVLATAGWNPNLVVNDSYAVNTGAGNYPAGTNVTIDAGFRPDHTFKGWSISPSVIFTSGNALTVTASFTMPDATVTATAIWDAMYVVTINESHATNTGAGSYTASSQVTIHAGTRTGWRFNTWSVMSGSISLDSASSTTTSFTMPSQNVVIEAMWIRTHIVTFDANGGYVSTRNTLSYIVDTGSSLGAVMPGTTVKPGYVFMGWFDTSAASGGLEYLASMRVNSDITAYARWGHTVTVLNSSAGTTGGGNHVENATVTIQAGSNAGIRFDRWIVDIGTISLASATSATTTFVMPGTDVTVRATWVTTNTISFDGNGGSPLSTLVTVDTGNSLGLSNMPTVARTGFVFMGWFDTALPSGGVQFTDTTVVTTDITVYARWGHTVSVIDSYAGSGSGQGNYVEGANVTINAGIRSGYSFAGWTMVPSVSFSSGSVSTTSASFDMPTVDVSATASWHANVTVLASYASPGSTGEGSYAQGAIVTLDAGIRPGYAFVNWQLTPGSIVLANPNAALTTFSMPNVPVTAIATWYGLYQVLVVSSDAVGTTGSGEYEVADPVTVYAGTKAGYSFYEWSITPSLALTGGTTLADTTIEFDMPASNVTATAIWHPNVIVNNSHAANTGAGSYAPGTIVSIDAGLLADHEFITWTVLPQSVILGSPTANATSFYMPAVPVTLDANWGELFDVSVTGSNAVDSGAGSYIQGKTVQLNAGTNSGYRFHDWTVVSGTLSINNASSTIASFIMPASDVHVRANWNLVYNVTINGSHAGATNSGQGSYVTSETVIIRAGSQPGFRFNGWTVDSGSASLVDASDPVTSFIMPSSNVTLTANWFGTNRVVFDGNGGLIGSSATFSVIVDSGSVLGASIPASPTRSGYVFMGWYSVAGSTGGSLYTASTTVYSDITAFARWGHTVTFNYQDSVTPDYQIDVVSGQAFGSSNMPTQPSRAGYVFMGWYTSSTGGGIFDPNFSISSHRTVYAQWGRTVSLTNSYAGALSGAGNYRIGDTVTISAGTNTGSVFRSWTVTSGTLILTSPNNATTSFIMPDENLTIWADWDGLYRVNIVDSSAGNSGSGNYLSGALVTIRAGSRSAFRFSGWTADSALVLLGNSTSATTNFIMPPSDVELTAHWDELFSTTVLSSYAGSANSGTGSYAENAVVTIDAGTRAGFKFSGWTVHVGNAVLDDASKAVTSFIMPAEAVIVQAAWVTTFTVSFNGNGGNPALQTFVVESGASIATLPSATNAGYVLIGWFSVSAPTGGQEFTSSTIISSDQTVYARWGFRVTVTDSYAANSGAGNYVASSTVNINAGTRAGYRFDTWTVSSGSVSLGAATSASTSFTMPSSDVELQANWVPSVVVSFNGNGGIPGIQTVVVDTGTALGARMPGDPLRSGYTFINWCTGSTAGSSFDSSTVVNSDITLYAQWGRTVTVSGSHAVTTGAGIYRPGDMVTIDAGVNGGYGFATWSVFSGSLTLANPSSATTSFTMPDSNLTLIANWATLYTLNVDGSYAGAGNTGAGSYTSGSQVAIQAGTRMGYTFAGWTSNAGGSFLNAGSTSTSFTMPPGNVTVTAAWTPISMRVSFSRNNPDACIGPFPTSMTVSYDSAYGILPDITSYGYRFEGWYTQPSGGVEIVAATQVTAVSDHTLYAQWYAISPPEVGDKGDLYTIMATSPVTITQAKAQAALQDSSLLIGYTNALAVEKATGQPAAIIVKNLSTLLPIPGAYLITLAVAAEPTTSVTVMVIVTETTLPPVIGVTHIIVADSAVYLTVAQASAIMTGDISAGLIAAAGVQVRAYNKETGASVPPSGLSISSTPPFDAVVGNYSVRFTVTTDPMATVLVNFIVIDATLPPVLGVTHVIMADSPVFLSTNEAATIINSGLDAGLIAKARVRVCIKDTGIFVPDITVSGGSLFTAVEGSYVVTFTATADPTATIDVLFVVTDTTAPPILGDNFLITASSPVTLTTGQAQSMVGNNLNVNLINAASVRAYNRRTGLAVSPLAISVLSSPAFVGAEGVYTVRFTVAADSSATITSTFVVTEGTVTAGDYYSISAVSPVMLRVAQASAIANNTLLLVMAAQVKAFDLVTGLQVLPSAIRVASGTLSASVGSYTIRFEVAADSTAYVDVVFIVTSALVVVGDNYVISANSPVLLNSNEASLMLGVSLDQNLIAAASVAAFDKNSGAALVASGITVSSAPAFAAVEGIYRVSFAVAADPQTSVTVLFIVSDSDVVVVGDSHVITASSPIRLSTAAAASASALDNGITAASVRAYRISDGAAVLSSAIQSSPQLSSAVGVHTVNYRVATDSQAQLDVKFIVADNNIVVEGSDYIISATSPVFLSTSEARIVEQNSSSALAANVTLYHKPTGLDVTSQVVSNDTFSAAPGVCPMTFFAPSEPTTAVTVLFIITDDSVAGVGDYYAITAASPVLLTVGEASALISSGLNVGLIARAGARAYNLSTGAQDGTLYVLSNGGFAASVGSYLVRIGVASDANAVVNVVFIVSDSPHIKEGTNSVITAVSPVLLSKSQAEALGNNTLLLISAANVRAWNKLTGVALLPGSIGVVSGSLGTNAGRYTLRFAVLADTDAYVDVLFVVTNDNSPSGSTHIISADNPVMLSVSQAAALLAGHLESNLINAADVRAFELSTGTREANIQVTGADLFSATEGSYTINFAVAVDPTANINVLFIVSDSNVFVDGDTHVIAAKSPVILRVDEAAAMLDGNLNLALIDAAKVKAFDRLTGAIVPSLAIAVSSNPAFAATVGSYVVRFTVIADSKASLDVVFIVIDTGIVVDGTQHIITGNSPVFLTEAAAQAALPDGGISAARVRAWNKTNASPASVSVAAGKLAAHAGNYAVTYQVDAERSCTLTVEFIVLGNQVLEDVDCLLTATTPIHLSTASAESLTDDGEAAAAVRAWNKANNRALEIDAELVSFTAKPYLMPLSSAIIESEAGAYMVSYSPTDRPTLTAKVLFVVDNNDLFIVGENHVVSARSTVSLQPEEVAGITDGGVVLASVVAYTLAEGQSATVSVLSGVIGSQPGSYTVTFKVNDDPNTTAAVTFVVLGNGGNGGDGGDGGGEGNGGSRPGTGGNGGSGGSRPGTGTPQTRDPWLPAVLLLALALPGSLLSSRRKKRH